MKKYKIYYTKISGLTQVGEVDAYCYIFKDGFFHFYIDEDHMIKDAAFKSINKDVIMYISC